MDHVPASYVIMLVCHTIVILKPPKDTDPAMEIAKHTHQHKVMDLFCHASSVTWWIFFFKHAFPPPPPPKKNTMW